MLNWLFSNAQGIVAVLEIAGFSIMGFMAFTGFFSGKVNSQRSDADKIADTLIARLKEQVEQMKVDMDKHTVLRDSEIKDLRGKIDHLTGRNAVLEELFKGRDPKMQTFLNDAPQLIEIARENNGLAKESHQAVTHLTDTLANFIESLQPLIVHFEGKRVAAGAV